jgi:hypothetical protein
VHDADFTVTLLPVNEGVGVHNLKDRNSYHVLRNPSADCPPPDHRRKRCQRRLSPSDIVLSTTVLLPNALHEKNNSGGRTERLPVITCICIVNISWFSFRWQLVASAFVQLDNGISFRDLT